MRKAIAAVLFLIIAIISAYGIKKTDRESKENIMDKMHLHYDADGALVLIDIYEGHMGIYDSGKPLAHMWNKWFWRVEPGLYTVSIYGEDVYLTDDDDIDMLIGLPDKDMDCIYKNVPPGTPVLAFRPADFRE